MRRSSVIAPVFAAFALNAFAQVASPVSPAWSRAESARAPSARPAEPERAESGLVGLEKDAAWRYLLGYYRASENRLEPESDRRDVEIARATERRIRAYRANPSEFACRYPAAAGFLAAKLGEPEPNCGRPFVVLGPGLETMTLDPERLYAVDYVVAGRGDSAASRFGHATLRLVFCSPRRAERGERCREDVQHHVMAGFSAQAGHGGLSMVGALTGRYPSAVSFDYATDAIHRYSAQDLREAVAAPLILDRATRSAFLKLLVERFWTYQGSYGFVSNNCAGEVLAIFKSVFPSGHAAHRLGRGVVAPFGLARALARIGLAEPLVRSALAQERGLWFPPRRRQLAVALSAFEPAFRSSYRSFEDYAGIPAATRAELVRESAALPQNRIHLLLLEEAVRASLLKRLEREAAAAARSGGCGSHPARERLARLSSAIEAHRLKAGEGVPSEAEIASEAERRALHRGLIAGLQEVYSCASQEPRVARLAGELKATEALIDALISSL